ncbi:MAG: LysM peptidoglycan-binding domain-containing protein, partial [Acidimicrobiia bacterium]
PKDYSITRKASWRSDLAKKAAAPSEYIGAEPTQITVEMFLDESEQKNGDVSKTVAQLLKALDPDQGTKDAPSAPYVIFLWGKAIRFRGTLLSVAVRYSLFRGTGIPVRGSATLTIKEMAEPTAGQNPTSGSLIGYRTHVVRAGDTLASVAYAEYGDPTRWRDLAEANDIDDPSRVFPGRSLLVPNL